jgi:hypothetical protein
LPIDANLYLAPRPGFACRAYLLLVTTTGSGP